MSDETVDSDFTEPETAASAPGPRPDRSLTIPPGRLAGSSHCLNCGTEMKGPFCYYCGQPDKNFIRFFPVLVRDVLSDVFELDSRFLRTMKPLLFKPGKLTRDFLDGLRFRYTPPLRLYIFSSMAFFILAAMLAGSAITVTSEDVVLKSAVDTLRDPAADEAARQEARQALEEIKPGLGDRVSDALEKAAETPTASDPATGEFNLNFKDDGTVEFNGIVEDDNITINGKPWDRETNPFVISWLPDWVNDWVNDEIEESPQKGKEIEANPNLIIDKVFDVLPATMFVLLPLSALILKFWYLFSGRYYVEHLILALHNHSFLFVVFLVTLSLDSLAEWLDPSEEGWVSMGVDWVTVALYLWIPLYFLLSLKRVYRQGWVLTFAKYMVIGLSYTVLLVGAASGAALLSFVLL